MAEFKKIDILRSLYQDNALPPDKMELIKSLEVEGQLEEALASLSENKAFIASLTQGAPEQSPPQPEAMPQQSEEKGLSDYLNALWEGYKGGASMAVQSAAMPVSGIAGLAKTITSGPEAGAQTIEQIQQAAANLIPAKPAEEAIGKTIQAGMEIPGVAPVVETAMKVPQAIGDISYEGALKMGLSPDTATYLGAAGKSALPVAIELMGLKGTKTAKKGLLKRVIEKADKTDFYDQYGNIKQEMVAALKNNDISLDEVADVLPENIISQKRAQPLAEQIKSAKAPEGIAKVGAMRKLAQTFQPDIDKIRAFESLDIDYLPQHVSNNPTAKAIAENLKDIPGSLMANREKRIVEQISQRADDIIIKGGGTTEKGELATRYINEAKRVIDSLAQESSKLYNEVGRAMPGNTAVEAEKIIGKLNEIADNMGGVEHLSAQEKRLLKTLAPETNPTYARLDQARRQIGEQLGGTDTVFRNVDRKHLSDLYSALTDDQETALLRHGDEQLLKTYLNGKYLTVQRKGIERQLQDTLGKKMTGDITKQMGSAVKGLATGDSRTFDNLLANIPKDVGADIRRDIVTTALNDAFLAGARGKDQLSIGGFGGYWKKLNRQPAAMKKLKDELTPETWDRLNNLAAVNDALKETMELSKQTGRQLSTPGLFDEVNSIAARVYGTAKKKAGTIPGLSALKDIATAPKNARSMAADELLTDRRFLNLIKQQAMGKVDTAKKESNMNRIIENLTTYKKWKKSLPETDLNELAVVGALGYFTGKQEEEAPQ